MIYLPFVYFSILSLILYFRYRRIDLTTIISLIYALSALASILMKFYGLADVTHSQISVFTGILYCFLLTICIFPILYGSSMLEQSIAISPIRNTKFLKLISLVAFVWFVLIIILGREQISYVLMNDMAEIRSEMYSGYGTGRKWQASLPLLLRLPFTALNLIFGCPWVLIFLGFYSMTSPIFPLKYSILLLLASISGPIYGIMGADRSAVAYWIIAFGVLFLLFRDKLTSDRKKSVGRLFVFISFALIAYFVAMTIARFGERDSSGGVVGSIISYLGQPYINFCYFFDNYELPFQHWGIVFPFTSNYILGVPAGGVVIQEIMTRLSNMETGIFYTFLGHWTVGVGQTWMIILVMIYMIMSYFIIYLIKKRKKLKIDSIFIYFAISSVVLFGLFAHYYAEPSQTISVIIMYFVINFFVAR